jgi:hypothetical protein
MKYFQKYIESYSETLTTLISTSFLLMAFSVWIIVEAFDDWSRNGRISFAAIIAAFVLVQYAGIILAARKKRKELAAKKG